MALYKYVYYYYYYYYYNYSTVHTEFIDVPGGLTSR